MLKEKKKLFFFRKIFSYVNTEKYFQFSQHEYIPKCSSQGLHPKSTAIKLTKTLIIISVFQDQKVFS